MTDRELMQMALDALERLHSTGDTQVFDMYDAPVLIPALRVRLAQPEPKAQFEYQNYGWWRDEEGKLQLGTQPQGE